MARNAGANIWRDGAFIWGMCAEHVSGRWFDKHKALFNDQVFSNMVHPAIRVH